MSGGHVHRGRLPALGALLTAVCATGIGLASAAATAFASAPHTGLRLPAPVREVDPLATPQLGLRPDRLLTSQVPGAVRDTESVLASLGPSGAPATVTDTQRLRISAQGNYIVRELGPARQAVGLGGSVPPVLELGTVVWQGFSPGARTLSARLTLDPGIEAARLPMSVRFAFADKDGKTAPLQPGGRAPAAGTVTITLTNNTSSNRVVQTGVASPGPLASVLDRLRRAGAHPRAAVPPT